MKNLFHILFYMTVCLSVSAAVSKEVVPPLRIALLSAGVGEDDSITVSLRIVIENIEVPSSRSLILTPVLDSPSEGKSLPLPPVIISGRRRALYDDRRQAVAPSADYKLPYTRIVNPGRKHRHEIDYTVRIPYTPWMRNAGLLLRQESRDCCRSVLLSIERLTGNLGLVPPCIKSVSVPDALAALAYARYNRDIRFVIPEETPARLCTTTGVVYIDYRQGSARIDARYGSNPWELADADSLFLQLRHLGVTAFRRISITGYASPEGAYFDNEKLARHRAEGFRRYIEDTYNPKDCPVMCTWIAEDWDELRRLLEDSDKPYKEQVFSIMDTYDIFQGRESHLMQLESGTVYKELLSDFFPRLRRVEIRVTYEMPPVPDAVAAELLYTHPDRLSLSDMYRVARYYPPATEQHREVYVIAACTYPANVAAQINAAAASLLLGDAATARPFLEQEGVKADRRADACRKVFRQLLIDETMEERYKTNKETEP